MSKQTLITSRDPKGLQATSLFEAAYNKAKLDCERSQRLNERGGEFQDGIMRLIIELTTPNQFANEEVRSNYVYPKEHKGPKPIKEQIEALAKILDLDPASALNYAKSLGELPDGAEGWFAVPSVDALAAKHFGEVTDPAEKYCRAVQLIHAKIANSRDFRNYREGEITPTQLELNARTAKALEQIAETQKGDILIIATQLGMRHRGRSVRRAREVFVANEFGFGSLAIGSIVLVHPERLVRWEELDMDCAGDDFTVAGGGSRAPIFCFEVGGVGFGAGLVGLPYGYYGSVSGFLPQ